MISQGRFLVQTIGELAELFKKSVFDKIPSSLDAMFMGFLKYADCIM